MAKPTRSKKGDPIDPEELSRRLQTYLTQQKMRVEERKQRAAYKAAHGHSPPDGKHISKNPPPAAQPPAHVQTKSRPDSFGAEKENVYHHVPSQAATQFARTTTPDPKRAIHALSQPAVQCHLEQIKVVEGNGTNPMQAINSANAERAALRQRNHFQMTESTEAVNLIDEARGVHGPEYQRFRKSLLVEDKDSFRPQRPRSKVILDMSGRDNWAQEDEKAKETVVRRKPSSWILLGKKSSRNSEKDEAVSGVGGPLSPPPDGRTKNLFARFKRSAV